MGLQILRHAVLLQRPAAMAEEEMAPTQHQGAGFGAVGSKKQLLAIVSYSTAFNKALLLAILANN